MNASVERVRAVLASLGGTHEIVELSEAARTAADAARLLGCQVEQIANSLVFRAPATDSVVLVMASGGRRVDVTRVAAALDAAVEKADADFVRSRTGFAIGGVAPVGHAAPPGRVLVDEELLKWPEIWAAGGHSHTVFRLTPDELVHMTGGTVTAVR